MTAFVFLIFKLFSYDLITYLLHNIDIIMLIMGLCIVFNIRIETTSEHYTIISESSIGGGGKAIRPRQVYIAYNLFVL